MAKDLREELSAIFELACKAMKDKLNHPEEVTAADLTAIRGFLKDNNITAIPVDGSALGELVQKEQETRYDFPFAPDGAGSLLPDADPAVRKVEQA